MKSIGKRTKDNKLYDKLYHTWKNMMDRCYKENCDRYESYGAKSVAVCKKWQNFDNFIEDIDLIKGFDLNKYLDSKICLDKDKIGNSKEYSLEKCCFITLEENNKYKPNQQKEIIGVSPDGEIYEFLNQSEFAKEHDLRQPTISDCLSGRVKKHKGWTFCFKQFI